MHWLIYAGNNIHIIFVIIVSIIFFRPQHVKKTRVDYSLFINKHTMYDKIPLFTLYNSQNLSHKRYPLYLQLCMLSTFSEKCTTKKWNALMNINSNLAIYEHYCWKGNGSPRMKKGHARNTWQVNKLSHNSKFKQLKYSWNRSSIKVKMKIHSLKFTQSTDCKSLIHWSSGRANWSTCITNASWNFRRCSGQSKHIIQHAVLSNHHCRLFMPTFSHLRSSYAIMPLRWGTQPPYGLGYL